MRKVQRRSKFRLIGGPYDGAVVMLFTAGTLEFTAKGQTGRYTGQSGDRLHWEEKRAR